MLSDNNRSPTSLTALAKPLGQAPTTSASSAQPAMKIMRRPGMGKDSHANSGAGTAESSMGPSKEGSDAGDESQQGTGAVSPTDSNVAKDKAALTRAEREARYKEKREELFGPQSENADSAEAVNEISRSSSRNEKKKKKSKDNDDGFEARSQFNAYYPTMQYPMNPCDQGTGSAAYFAAYGMHPGNPNPVMQPSFIAGPMLPQGFQHRYSSMNNGQGFPTPMNANAMNAFNGQNGQQTFDQQTPTQYFSVMQQQGIAMGHQPSAVSSPAHPANTQMNGSQSQISDQQWPQNGFSYAYPQARDPQHFFPSMTPSAPYQYGQLPTQQGGKMQHPLPGSYSRQQTFNPQTRAFVPNSSIPSQMPSYGNVQSHPTTRNAAMPLVNVSQMPYGSQPQGFTQIPSMGNYNSSAEVKNHGTRKSSTQSNGHHSSGPQSPAPSSLSKWGTPANLPPKPPPPEAPSMPDAQHSLPMNNQFNVNVQPLSAGQPMPHYRNGVYSRPSTGV